MGNFIKFKYTLQCVYSSQYINPKGLNQYPLILLTVHEHVLNSYRVSFIALMIIKVNKIYMHQ